MTPPDCGHLKVDRMAQLLGDPLRAQPLARGSVHYTPWGHSGDVLVPLGGHPGPLGGAICTPRGRTLSFAGRGSETNRLFLLPIVGGRRRPRNIQWVLFLIVNPSKCEPIEVCPISSALPCSNDDSVVLEFRQRVTDGRN